MRGEEEEEEDKDEDEDEELLVPGATDSVTLRLPGNGASFVGDCERGMYTEVPVAVSTADDAAARRGEDNDDDDDDDVDDAVAVVVVFAE